MASRLSRIDSLNTNVSENTTKIAAYQDMQSLLKTVVTSLEALRSAPGSTGQSNDVFRDRTAYLTSSSSTAAGTYLAATIEEGTDLGSHTINITQTATTNIIKSGSQSSKSSDLGWSGDITLGTVGGNSANIAITATMSLADMADAINVENAATGITASVMKVSDSAYILVLTADDTGATITASDSSGTLLSGSDTLAMLDSNGNIASDNVLQEAKDAILTVDGVKMTRSSNDIDDILEGTVLHLYSAPSTDTTLTLEVDHDLTSIKSDINTFVDAYNAFRDLVLTNQTTASDGTAAVTATLFGDSTLRNISQKAQSILTSAIDETSLASIGITLDADNKLVSDETTLDSALLNDFDAVQALFTYKTTTSSGDLALVRHPDSSLNFTLDVTVDTDGNLSDASIDGDSSMFTISGSTIKGVEGTQYAGLTLVYTGTTTKSITVDLSQGIADKLYTTVDSISNSNSGTLADLITSLEDSNTSIENRISDLEESANSYSDYLYSSYGTIAAHLASAQSTLDLLQALLNASNSN